VIRIEIGAMPPLLRSILSAALEGEGDFTVVAPVAGDDRVEPDVLVVCRDRAPHDCIPVGPLAAAAPPAIVAIDAEGLSATVLWVTAERTALGAATDLRDAVRIAARRRSTRGN
jgi:hypothetical protein